jgi:histidinol-phosphate phosphatase family protein
LLDHIPSHPCSLEADIFAALAAEGRLDGVARDGFFIDIGVPQDYAAADQLIGERRRRAAVLFDRDGVLNEDRGYTHRPEDLRWLPGAREAVKRVNEAGRYAFVVTNQAGVARGLYGIRDVERFHAEMDRQLAEIGAHIDEYAYCPYHPEGVVHEYARDAECRKPRPGMILGLMRRWPMDARRSLLVGDKESDQAAAAAAGIPAILFQNWALAAPTLCGG